MFAAVAAWFHPAAEDKLKAKEAELLSLAGLQGASHLKVGEPDRFHNVIKIPARAPADPPLPPLVIAHGYGSGLGMWFRNLHSLSADRDVFAFDWLGMGASARPSFEAADQDAAEAFFLEGFNSMRRDLGLQRFVFAGHSMGGYLAAAYALQHPQHVAQLILVSPVGVPRKPSDWDDRIRNSGFIWKTFGSLWSRGYTPQGIVRLLGPGGPGMVRNAMIKRFPGEPPEVLESIAPYLYQITAAPGSGEYALNLLLEPGAWARRPLCERLLTLQVPVSFVYGSRDWMDPQHAHDVAPKLAVPASVHVVSNSGHHMYLENCGEFNTVMQHIMAAQPPS